MGRKQTGLLALAIVFGLSAGMAAAQTRVPGANFVAMWDMDGNGQVTLAEAQEKRADLFTAFDADEDDTLSAEELLAWSDMRDENRAQMQANGQGRGPAKGAGMGPAAMAGVTRADFLASTPYWFARMDRNRDGVLSTADFGRR